MRWLHFSNLMSWFTSSRFKWSSHMKLGLSPPIFLFALAAGTSYGGYIYFVSRSPNADLKKKPMLSAHEKRFRSFASLQYKGVLFMTPYDFMNSLIKDEPTREHQTISIGERDLEGFLRRTPSKYKMTSNLFRQIKNDGVLSYSEYLFLLQVLTKPHSGFEIAFKMLDHDLSGSVDAHEFAKLNQVVTHMSTVEGSEDAPTDLMLPPDEVFRTTLMAYLFGKNRDSHLTYEEFIRFMHNFQTEALEMEFRSYSAGMQSITPVDFAYIILRHTTLSQDDRDHRIRRLQAKLSNPVPITFEEYQRFFNFLNCLDDFHLAMKLYTIAGRPISLPEFHRAVKACTGYELSPDLLNTVFALFDMDDDGRLSYPEFIQIMRERRARQTQAHMVAKSTDSEESVPTFSVAEKFRHCVTNELRNSSM